MPFLFEERGELLPYLLGGVGAAERLLLAPMKEPDGWRGPRL